MATTKKAAAKKSAPKNATVTIKAKPDTIYAAAAAELERLSSDDAAGRRVDKDLEAARGKDTWRTHLLLTAESEAEARAVSRHEADLGTQEKNHKALQQQVTDVSSKLTTNQQSLATKLGKQVDAARDKTLATLDDQHTEAISVAETHHAETDRRIGEARAEILRDVGKSKDQVLNGQAVLGESVTSFSQTVNKKLDAMASANSDAFNDLQARVQKVHENLAKSQSEDGKTILETLQANNEAVTELVQSIHSDVDTKLRHFREEFQEAMEKVFTTTGNQHAATRGDVSVMLSLLSDIRKDQIGRPDRR